MSKTISASDIAYDDISEVKKHAHKELKITVSLSDAIRLGAAAYFELEKLKLEKKQNEAA